MDHDEASDSDGNAHQNEIADDPSLRGNSTESTSKSVANDDGEDDEANNSTMDEDDGQEDESMDVDDDNDASGVDDEDNSVDVSAEDAAEASASSDVEQGNITHAPSADDAPDGDGDEASEAEQQQPSDVDAADTMQSDQDDPDEPSNGEQQADAKPVGESVGSSEAIQPTKQPESTEAKQSSNPPGTSLSEEQGSPKQGPDTSIDVDDTDMQSDKASSADVQSDSGDKPPPGPDSKRAPLENAYGPFIHPEDTCLEDARERLHTALEQTRLLRESFSEQAYERYRCVIKPAPDSLEEILDPILANPKKAGEELQKKSEAIQVEKDLEKKQAQKAGIGPEELAYFGEGLHLVVLPEDEVDEAEIDLTVFPTRGPIDPETGELVEDLKAAFANQTDQVFDRIRRIRAIRMGGDITDVLKKQAAVKQLTRNMAQESSKAESFTPGYAAAAAAAAPVAPPPSSSPAPSMDSDVGSDAIYQKGPLQHLLTLAPDAEGSRPDGSYTAVQSALIARGVGLHETKRDLRINPQHQRMIQPNYFSPETAHQFLPPLLRPNDLFRLQAADARREGVNVQSTARDSIKSVVEDICLPGGSGVRKSLDKERSALEIGLLRRMHDATINSNGAQVAPSVAAKATIESLHPGSETGDFDPLLAFSVMNAVGLVRKKESKEQSQENGTPQVAQNPEGSAYMQALGLESLSGLDTVSKFFNSNTTVVNGKKRSRSDDNDETNNAKRSQPESDVKTDNGSKKDEEVCQIRGGGGQDDASESKEAEEAKKQDKGMISTVSQIRDPPGFRNPYATHQLGVHPDPFNTAALAHQFNMPIGTSLSDFYIQNQLKARTDALAQHAQLSASLGLLPGQMNMLQEQDLARLMLLQDHHNAAAASRYQAALSTFGPQNPFGFAGSSLTQSTLPAFHANQQSGMNLQILQRKRSSSLSEKLINNNGVAKIDVGQASDITRAASAPPSPHSPATGLSRRNSSESPICERSFAMPVPPKGLQKGIADLIVHAKFHEAHSLYKGKTDNSDAVLVKFLLSLGAAVPIPKEYIKEALVKKLSSSNYQLRLHEFVGSSSSASTSRDVIVAIISIWLWAEHKDCLKHVIVDSGQNEGDSSYSWLVNMAIDKSLSALATFFDSRPSGMGQFGLAKETDDEEVAAIASKSLADEVFVDHRSDASFPIMEDLLKLLDTLRTDALKVKTQERVLLAALASRGGNLTEAFSNAYVSSIVRAGVALGHENVCELAQDEGTRASTMLPYDYFLDNFGVWEEPCRPTTGFHSAVQGDELKKQAHARSVIQKSMKKLQSRLGLKGGISDGGPYFPTPAKNKSKQSTMTAAPPLQRTPSGSLKRRASYESLGASAGHDSTFNPDYHVVPIMWNPNEISNFPYGQYEGSASSKEVASAKKKRKLNNVAQGDTGPVSLAAQHQSTQELEWEDVANMFFHGGSTRSIDIDYDFGSNNQLGGKKKIFAPLIQNFDRSTLETEHDDGSSSDEDISDETVLQRHQDVLDDMKLKLDAVLEMRQLHSRGRKARTE